MSITFTAEMSAIIGQRIECACGTHGPEFTDYEVAVEWLRDKKSAPSVLAALGETRTYSLPGCTDDWCDVDSLYVVAVEEDPAPEANFANTNAIHLLQTLGLAPTPLTPDADVYCGTIDAEDFLGRVLIALAVAPVDEGIPAHEVPGPGAQFIDCGRRPGYTQEALAHLRDVADFAVARGRKVVWS